MKRMHDRRKRERGVGKTIRTDTDPDGAGSRSSEKVSGSGWGGLAQRRRGADGLSVGDLMGSHSSAEDQRGRQWGCNVLAYAVLSAALSVCVQHKTTTRPEKKVWMSVFNLHYPFYSSKTSLQSIRNGFRILMGRS